MLAALGYLSGITGLLSFPPYIRDIFKGTTKPERATWFIWTVLNWIAFAGQFAEGATHSLWMTGVQAVFETVVFLLSIRKGVGGLSRRDIVGLMVAALGLILWYLTRDALFALLFVVLVDGSGLVLTVLKTYEDPESETISAWVWSGLSGLLACFAVGSFNVTLLIYPFYIFLANMSVLLAIYLGKKRLKLQKGKV